MADLASQKIGFSQNASQDEEIDAFLESGCRALDSIGPHQRRSGSHQRALTCGASTTGSLRSRRAEWRACSAYDSRTVKDARPCLPDSAYVVVPAILGASNRQSAAIGAKNQA